MTIMLKIPEAAETGLQAAANRAGVTVNALLERVVVERFGAEENDEFAQLVARIGGPAPDVDVTREGIYADI